MNPSTSAKLKFLASVKATNPGLYNAAMHKGGGLSGLGATVEEMITAQNAGTDFPNPLTASTTTALDTPWYQSFLNSTIDTIKQLAPAYVATTQAKTCIDVNASRAKQGLSPVDCGAAGLSPQVNVGVSSDVRMMGYVALGIGAVALFMLTKRR